MHSQRQRLLTTCPKTGSTVPTHVVAREKRLQRLSGRVVYWCPACRGTHGFDMLRGERVHPSASFGELPGLNYQPA